MKKSHDALRNTNLSTLYLKTSSLFGEEQGNSIYAETLSEYETLKALADDRGSKTLRKHLNGYILPTVALYRAIQSQGIAQPKAKKIVDGILHDFALQDAKAMSKFRRIPFPLFKSAFKLIMKLFFPIVGWGTVWTRNDKTLATCECHRCFYLETLTSLQARELCEAFCKTDVTSYGAIAPEILFERKNTIEKGASVCDFTFRKGSNAKMLTTQKKAV